MLLKVRDLHSYYEESHILQGVSFELREGEIASLLGRNGVGKTTTLKSIMGLVVPRSGEIKFKDQELRGMPPFRIANLGIGYVPEDRRIFPRLSVKENLLIGMKTGQNSLGSGWSLEKIYEYFPALKAREKHKGAYLSGGEQQMLAIARALMGNPEVLLLDEPTEGLAPKIVEVLEKVILDIHGGGVAILLVEQNIGVVLRLASRVYVMSKGSIVFQGTGEELKEAKEVREKYLEV